MTNFFKRKYQKIVNSIAFFPAIIALGFLVLCALMITLDYSQPGKLIKSQLDWLRLKDASTARSIIGAIASGILSLTVFSFSMVMIVLNQAASQMTNRVLGQLIGNKFQQFVLGTYIGTIIYGFFLLSTIRDIESGIYIPALSTYLLILITIFDIFLFIYFLHYITQSVKYEVVIQKIFDDTFTSLEKACLLSTPSLSVLPMLPFSLAAVKSGIFEGVELDALKAFCQKHSIQIHLLLTPGTFVLPGTPLLTTNQLLSKELQRELLALIFTPLVQTIQGNYLYGFSQLREIALKALSPGINDPGTALISLHALASLLLYRAQHYPQLLFHAPDGTLLLVKSEVNFEALVLDTLNPIWDYGQEDRLLCRELHELARQLQQLTSEPVFTEILIKVSAKLASFPS